MNLLAILQSRRDIAAMDAKSAIAALNAKTIQREDHTLYGPVGLLRKLPAEAVEGAARAFIAAGEQFATMKMLNQTFSTYGFDFAALDTIAQIDALVAAGMPAELGDALKSVGMQHISLVEQQYGVGQEAVEADLTWSLTELAKADLLDKIDQVRGQVANGSVVDLNGVVSALQS